MTGRVRGCDGTWLGAVTGRVRGCDGGGAGMGEGL